MGDDGLVILLDLRRVQVEGTLDLVDLGRYLDRDLERVHEPVEHGEEAAHQCELHDLDFVEVFRHGLENIIAVTRRVPGHVLGPQDRGFLPRAEDVRGQVLIGADGFDLFPGDACRLTKRRVVRRSICAPVDVARLDDHHLFDLRREMLPAP